MPAVTEPLIVWITSGSADTQERGEDGSWITTRIQKGSLFVTAGGDPYEFKWTRLSAEPLEVVMVLLDLALYKEVLESVHGDNADLATLRDCSGVDDPVLIALLQCLRIEATRLDANRTFTRGVAQAICAHLARQYTELESNAKKSVPSLPLFKLRQITAWMTAHLDQPFSLALLAGQAGMSEHHFNRLFKRAMGVAPSQHHIRMRVETAKKLLRETDKTIVTISNEVGYSNPSHFSHQFRKSTGLSPSDYRRQGN
ncbi:helix-turn-helix transcriptional regulator [Pseudomonas putida]|uniref:helix-turn-helix domain-containing protein n=1 Tax=Pseudomonas putida TaxID=303 RepID=UPI0018AB401C|nr:AraC family transcriptional regulator [Pseudomonas putida]MBF8668310.1 helix-turn-helix transcriptional regulator [Pseudomonas putida]MBF8710871.1 helix-turn-helix transcriptional regulator [Pseudomonas putida]